MQNQGVSAKKKWRNSRIILGELNAKFIFFDDLSHGSNLSIWLNMISSSNLNFDILLRKLNFVRVTVISDDLFYFFRKAALYENEFDLSGSGKIDNIKVKVCYYFVFVLIALCKCFCNSFSNFGLMSIIQWDLRIVWFWSNWNLFDNWLVFPPLYCN